MGKAGILVTIFICSWIVMVVYYGTNKRVDEERAYARAHSGIDFNVVSGWNEKSGNAFSIAIENPATDSWETFPPCTEEQLMLRVGDKIRMESTEILLPIAPQLQTSEYKDLFRKNCFLKIVSLTRAPGN